jgi:hypothetical protein
MVGTANLNQSTAATKTRTTSMRLTKALMRKQIQEDTKPDTFDLKRALLSARCKISKQKPAAKSNVRRDLLAQAKASAVTREWKDR